MRAIESHPFIGVISKFRKPLECYYPFMYNKMEIIFSGVNYAITRLAWRYTARGALYDAVAAYKALYRPLSRQGGYGIYCFDGRVRCHGRAHNLLCL